MDGGGIREDDDDDGAGGPGIRSAGTGIGGGGIRVEGAREIRCALSMAGKAGGESSSAS